MAWVKVDDKMSRGPKVKRAAAVLGNVRKTRGRILAVWLDAMSYCNLQLTDGFLPDHEVDDLADVDPPAVLQAMTTATDELGAIVERDDARGGWQFRNYAEYQPTKDAQERKRHEATERRRAWRERAGHAPVTPMSQRDKDAITQTSHSPGPALTEPNRTEPALTEDLKPKPMRKERAEPVGFGLFYEAYPRKEGRAKALAAWMKLAPNDLLVAAITTALVWQRRQSSWLKDGGEFVPHASSWLNGRRWEDQPANANPAAQSVVSDSRLGALLDKIGLGTHERGEWFHGASLNADVIFAETSTCAAWITRHYLPQLSEAAGCKLSVVVQQAVSA